jgi:hypothetical protein
MYCSACRYANISNSVDQIYLSFDMPLREHGEQRGDGHGLQTRASKHT